MLSYDCCGNFSKIKKWAVFNTIYRCHIFKYMHVIYHWKAKRKTYLFQKQSHWVHEGVSKYCQSKMVTIHGLFKLQYQYLSG